MLQFLAYLEEFDRTTLLVCALLFQRLFVLKYYRPIIKHVMKPSKLARAAFTCRTRALNTYSDKVVPDPRWLHALPLALLSWAD